MTATISQTAANLLHLLQHGVPPREVYQAEDRSWWVTHGGGAADSGAVRELVAAGLIVRTYDTCDGIYHCGKTLDMKATELARVGKSVRERRWIRVYTDGTKES